MLKLFNHILQYLYSTFSCRRENFVVVKMLLLLFSYYIFYILENINCCRLPSVNTYFR